MRIQVFDITSSHRVDDFNSVLEDTVNLWINKHEKYYEIIDVAIFGFDYLRRTGICHAKVIIKYEQYKKS